MKTTKQISKMIEISEALKEKEMSIVELSKKVGIKRSTLNYYLNILELEGFIERERIQEKKTGRPTMIKFNREKYKIAQGKWEREMKEQEHELLNNPLTGKILKFLKENPNPLLKEIEKNMGNAYKVSSHLSWLISKGLIINQFNLTKEGEKFLEKHSK